MPGQKQYFATVNIDQYQTEIKNLKEQNSNLVNEIQNLKNTIAQQNLFSSNVKEIVHKNGDAILKILELEELLEKKAEKEAEENRRNLQAEEIATVAEIKIETENTEVIECIGGFEENKNEAEDGSEDENDEIPELTVKEEELEEIDAMETDEPEVGTPDGFMHVTHLGMPSKCPEMVPVTMELTGVNAGKKLYIDPAKWEKTIAGRFQCPACPYVSRYRNSFARHIRIHTSEKPFKCEFCGVGFRLKQTCDRHMKKKSCRTGPTFEKDEKGLYKCPHIEDDCHYRTNNRHIMEKHVRRHTGEKPFTCDICGKKFKQKTGWQRHLKNEACFPKPRKRPDYNKYAVANSQAVQANQSGDTDQSKTSAVVAKVN